MGHGGVMVIVWERGVGGQKYRNTSYFELIHQLRYSCFVFTTFTNTILLPRHMASVATTPPSTVLVLHPCSCNFEPQLEFKRYLSVRFQLGKFLKVSKNT